MAQISALTPFPGNYANAVICVSNNEISNVFRVKLPIPSRPTFYVDADGFNNLNVSTNTISNSISNFGTITFAQSKKMNVSLGNAYVYGVSGVLDFILDPSNIPYKVDQKTIRDDAIRNLAHYLFKTQYGAKIFVNNTAVWNDIDTKINSLFIPGVSGNLYSILNNANDITTPQTQTNVPDTNIGYHIYNAIQTVDPDRFKVSSLKLSNNPIDGGSNTTYQMPFRTGDSLYIKFNINYSPTQGSVVGLPDPSGRYYQVRLLIL
jgi:hypothetical protein